MGRQKKQRTHPAPENIGDHMKENLQTIRKSGCAMMISLRR